jgi:hypothetical protein
MYLSNRVVADLAKPMDETDTSEVIVTATNHEHAGRLRTLQLTLSSPSRDGAAQILKAASAYFARKLDPDFRVSRVHRFAQGPAPEWSRDARFRASMNILRDPGPQDGSGGGGSGRAG